MLVRRARRTVVVISAALGLATLTGCGGDDSDSADRPSPAAPSITQATGTPFTATMTGPELAEPGQTIAVTVTNTGRLPNLFQLEFDPAGAATVAPPASFSLGPGESRQVQLQVQVSPFDVNLESASGGLGDYLATLEVGSTS